MQPTSEIELDRPITLVAKHGKQQGYFAASPVKDSTTMKLLGVEDLSEDEKRKDKRPIGEDTQRKITHGITFDPNSIVDQTDWKWIRHNKEIAPDFDSAHSDDRVLYYIEESVDKEVATRNKSRDVKFEAETLIRNMTENERKEVMKYLGQNASDMKDNDVKDWMLSRIEIKNGADEIIRAKKDPQFKTRLFLFQLQDLNKVKRNSSGIYSYGEIVLGTNMISAIEWLDNDKNRDIVGKLLSDVKKGKNVRPSVIDELKAEADADAKDKAVLAGEAGGNLEQVTV